MAGDPQPPESLRIILAAVDSLLSDARDADDGNRAAGLEELRERLVSAQREVAPQPSRDAPSREP